jgi:5-methylcytosine-specific restriction endonuclease McrA
MTITDDGAHHQMGAPRPDCVCTGCGRSYAPHLAEWAFRTHRTAEHASSRNYRKRVCRECERQRRQRNRWAVKAQNVIRHHANRFGIDRDELITVYGWEPTQLAHDAEHLYTNGRCSYCPRFYAEMGNGTADITLDIQDRGRPPYYCTNTKWCCQSCNRRKGAMTPEAFEANRQLWELWRRSKIDPPGEQGTLF